MDRRKTGYPGISLARGLDLQSNEHPEIREYPSPKAGEGFKRENAPGGSAGWSSGFDRRRGHLLGLIDPAATQCGVQANQRGVQRPLILNVL